MPQRRLKFWFLALMLLSVVKINVCGVAFGQNVGFSGYKEGSDSFFIDQLLHAFSRQRDSHPDCSLQKFNSARGTNMGAKQCKPVLLRHPKGKPLSFELKRILEFFFHLKVPVEIELYEEDPGLEVNPYDFNLTDSQSAMEWLADNEAEFGTERDFNYFILGLENDDQRESSITKLQGLFGLYDGVSFSKHFAKRLTTKIDSSNSADLYHEYKDGIVNQIAKLAEEDQETSYRARFKPNFYNTLNALSIAALGTLISFKASTQHAWKKGPVFRSHVFLFAWGILLLELQREFGSFKMQGGEWYIEYSENGESAELLRRPNRMFFYATSFVQESILLTSLFYGFKLMPSMPVYKTFALALVSAFSFVPIEKIRNRILLQAERERLKGNDKKYVKLTREGNLIGFIYWNFVFNVFKNLSAFKAPLPIKDVLARSGVFFKNGFVKGTRHSLHFWDLPLVGLGLVAFGVDMDENLKNIRNQAAIADKHPKSQDKPS